MPLRHRRKPPWPSARSWWRLESGAGAEDMPRVVSALAGILERVAEGNDAAAAAELLAMAPASAFRATTKPGISMCAFMARISRFAGCSPASCYVYLNAPPATRPAPSPRPRRRLVQHALPAHHRRAYPEVLPAPAHLTSKKTSFP